MIRTFGFDDIMNCRDIVLSFSPDTSAKEIFKKVDQLLISHSRSVELMESCKFEVNFRTLKSDWYPIINKSNAIGSLFNQLENICALDRDSLI